MSKLYFSVSKMELGAMVQHAFFSKSKTHAKNHLRDQGYIPKLILTWEDLEKLEAGTLALKDMTPKLQEFALSQKATWAETRESMLLTS